MYEVCQIAGTRPVICRAGVRVRQGHQRTRDTTKGANMKRYSPLRFRAVTIAAMVLVALLAVSASAQIQSGNIFGKVQAKDGSALPGVTVTLTGAGTQSTVSDATGNFRFLSLSPGTYGLKAELAGFGTSTRQGVTVNLGRNADVTMTLNPSAAESIVVTAEAPLLDV